MSRRTGTIPGRPVLAHVTSSDISLALLLGSQLKAFSEAGYEVVGISSGGQFVPQLEAMGVHHHRMVHATRSLSVHEDLRAAHELFRILADLNPDIVHTHNPKPGIYGRLVASVRRTPVIVNTVHGLYATPDDRFGRRMIVYQLERLAAHFSDAELVQNPEDLITLERIGVPGRKLHLLGNGIDLEQFSPHAVPDRVRHQIRCQLGASPDTVVVTAVGRLVSEKGFPEFFAAARHLRTSRPNALFVAVGPEEPAKTDGLSRSDMDEAIKAGVRILGYRADVVSIYAASDIFVLPSHREGMPRSAIEASAMGLPIVATDIRGCRQVVDDGSNGILVSPRDALALSAAIAHLIDAPELRLRFGQAGVLKARAQFDQEAVINKTLTVYRDLLERRR